MAGDPTLEEAQRLAAWQAMQAARPSTGLAITPAAAGAVSSMLAPSSPAEFAGNLTTAQQALGTTPVIGSTLSSLVGGVTSPILAGMQPRSGAAAAPVAGPGEAGAADPLAALQAALTAGGAPAKSGGTGTSSTTTRLGRPEDEGMLAQARGGTYSMEDAQQQARDEQARVNLRHDSLIKDWVTEAKEAKDRYGDAGAEIRAEYRRTATELRAARDDLKRMDVNPTRLWDTMPTAQRVLMAIGTMFGGAGEVATDGKVSNDVARWWTSAVDKDIESQREAIKRKMSEVELGVKERDSLWSKWMSAEEQIRTGSTRAAQQELARITLATDDVSQKKALAQSIFDLGKGLRETEHGEYVAKQNQVTKTQSHTSGGTTATAGPDAATADAQMEAFKAASRVKAIVTEAGGMPLDPTKRQELKESIYRARLFQAKGAGLTGKALSGEVKAQSEMDPAMGWASAIIGAASKGQEKLALESIDALVADTQRPLARTIAAAMAARAGTAPAKGRKKAK